MITLLERRAVLTTSKTWSRQAQFPSILLDGVPYDPHLDLFFAYLPTDGVRSRHSIRGYAYDLLNWVRFLDEARAKTVWQATLEDVDAYHHARRHDDAANRISATSWNRAVAALDKFYNWAVKRGLVGQIPFTYREVWRRFPSDRGRPNRVTRNSAYERAAKRSDVKFLSMEDYRDFRTVGVCGLNLDGSERPRARNRTGTRNVLFADLLAETGLRLEEASSLLTVEIEGAIRGNAKGDKQVAFRLSEGLTKGNKERTIRIPASLLSRLRSYIEIERAVAVQKFRARGGIKRIPGALMCGLNAGKITTTSGPRRPVRLDNLTPDERRLLVIHDAEGTPVEPAALWLSEVGLPIAPNSWEAAFMRASRRCQAASLACDAHPHKLRHTFAVYKLEQLIRQRSAKDLDLSGAAYRRLLGDPLQQVQHLLGHASIETTYIYLGHLAGYQEMVDLDELFPG